MPRLVIDNLEVEVSEGTKVIDAAEQLGIMIPRFCYHRALGPVGACRVCAVRFLEGPVKGVEMSCMLDAKDGMVVSTTDDEAVGFRKYIIEWLMLNHPHDCPVCDEGGHCLLQDETVSGGHGLRRYLGQKRTYYDQHLGPLIQHEMNRCIHCFRCRRFYQEFAGYRDLGAMQIGNRMYFGRFSDGTLESPFSGNLIDICPTGVFTDKPARYKGRRWDFERGPSICLHCSLGCNTIGAARYREIVRQEARLNEVVNGHFICDRGRFGYDFANHPRRPRRPRVGGNEVSWQEALEAAVKALNEIGEKAGPDVIACLGSIRSSLETQAELKRFCRVQRLPEPHFFLDSTTGSKVKIAVSRLDGRSAVSMGEIKGSDFILTVGADPMNEAPMLALAMRQAHREGGTVAAIDPRPLFLPFNFDHIPVKVEGIDLCVSVLVKGALAPQEVEILGPAAHQFYDRLPDTYPSRAEFQDLLSVLGQKLKESERVVIVSGTDIVRETTPGLLADHASILKGTKEKVGLFYLLPGPNAFGAALLSSAEGPVFEVIEAIEKGLVKALLLLESDLFWQFPDRERLSKALDRLDLLLVMDYLPSQSVERAHILLPTLTHFEGIGSSFMNQEGRVQFSWPIHETGLPISQISGGKHPPRTFMSTVPGGEARRAGEILKDLASGMPRANKGLLEEDIWAWLTRQKGLFAGGLSAAEQPAGVRLVPDKGSETHFSRIPDPEEMAGSPADLFELLLVDWTFGTEELSSYSRYIHQIEKAPQIIMHTEDVSKVGLEDRGRVALHLPGGQLELELRALENMARGVMVLPRHRQLTWQKLKGWPAMISAHNIEKL